MAQILSARVEASRAPFLAYCRRHQSGDTPDASDSPPRRARRRTRRRIEGSDGGGGVPSLADFMHTAKVKRQYRCFIRLANFIDGRDNATGATSECRAAVDEVRVAYRQGMKKDVDSLSKKMAFSEGERKLKELEAMVGFSPSRKEVDGNSDRSAAYDDDSWINIKDEEDQRGRMG
ncbi:hypothetical protein THAOC_06456, partial [Thalassiosira oceanica]